MQPEFEWLDPRYPIDETGQADALERQLRVEASPAHVLYGADVRLIARRADTDDALFQLADGRVAEVHLTWKSSAEADPRWPVTAIFASIDEWAGLSMTPLHDELSKR